MKPLRKSGKCRLLNGITGRMDTIEIQLEALIFDYRKMNYRGNNGSLGCADVRFQGSRKGARVPYRNLLEQNFLSWIADCPNLRRVVAHPIRVTGYFDGIYRQYTPAYLVDIDPVPPNLVQLGFAHSTFVELVFCDQAENWDVLLRMKMLHLATGFAVARITDRDITLPARDDGALAAYYH